METRNCQIHHCPALSCHFLLIDIGKRNKGTKTKQQQQVKGLSIEHEKLAVAHRHAAENNNSSTDSGTGNAEVLEAEVAERVMKREPTPAPPYAVPNIYSSAHYYESPQKRTRLMR